MKNIHKNKGERSERWGRRGQKKKAEKQNLHNEQKEEVKSPLFLTMPEGFKETFVTVIECEECSHGIILFLSQETSKYSYFFYPRRNH